VATFAADGGHVRPVAAHGFAALPAGYASFIGREFVGRSLRMGRASAFARNLSLLRRVHRRKTAFARCHLVVSLRVRYRGQLPAVTAPKQSQAEHEACPSSMLDRAISFHCTRIFLAPAAVHGRTNEVSLARHE
jgi:hypothetical protein